MIKNLHSYQPTSDGEDRSLRQLERLSDWLDASIPIPGTAFRVGWDTLIGLIPGVGDIATTAVSSWIVWQAKEMGVSKWTLARMIMNVGIDAVFGSIPLVGDAFDAAYKANLKNVALLRRHLEKRSSKVKHFDVRAASRHVRRTA